MCSESDADQVKRLAEFYEKYFGMSIDKSVTVPEYEEGFKNLVVIPEGLTISRVLEVYDNKGVEVKNQCACDVEKIATSHARYPEEGTYAIRVGRLQRYSGNGKKPKGSILVKGNRCKENENGNKGETLLERLVHGLIHEFQIGGYPLDYGYTIACLGSSDQIQCKVPIMCRFGKELRVGAMKDSIPNACGARDVLE